MAIAFVQSASNGAANAGPFDVTISPATAGNLLLAFHTDGDTADNAMPAISGFTDVGSSEQYANGSGGDCNSKAWYKYAVGGETTITFPDTGGGTNDGVSGVVMEFSGVASAAQGGPFSTAPVLASGTGSANADNGPIATAAGDAVVIMAGAATASTNIGNWTAPANYTTNANLGTAGSDTIETKAAMAYRLSGYSNPENPPAWAMSGSAAGDSWTAVTLALKAAPAPVDLVVQEASHAHAADNLALTQVHALTVQEAAHAHAADNLALTQVHQLVVQEALHTHAADNVVLEAGTNLVVADALHSHTADNLALTQVHELVVQEASHAHSADNLVLTQVHQLVIQDSLHSHLADNLVLTAVAGAITREEIKTYLRLLLGGIEDVHGHDAIENEIEGWSD